MIEALLIIFGIAAMILFVVVWTIRYVMDSYD